MPPLVFSVFFSTGCNKRKRGGGGDGPHVCILQHLLQEKENGCGFLFFNFKIIIFFMFVQGKIFFLKIFFTQLLIFVF